jgi:protein NrfD
MPPSDTFFTQAPHWHWLVVFYFFFGGLAGGSFFLAAMIDLFGHEIDRPLARLAYYTAFLMIIPAAPLLILDLNRPERFWHMLIQANNAPMPILKWWSPMSIGSWALMLFSGVAFLAVVGSLAQEGRLPAPFRALRHGIPKIILAIIGGLTGFFIASYTGVLLAVSNRPVWADTNLIGLLFLVSAASTSAALLLLLAGWRRRHVAPESISWLKRMDTYSLGLEFVVLVLLIISLGAVARAWLNLWGLLLIGGVMLLGVLVPLALHWRPRMLGARSMMTAALLVLAGGFLLRTVIVMSAEGIPQVTARPIEISERVR